MPRIKQRYAAYAKEAFLCEIRKQQGILDMMNSRALSEACGIPYQTLLRRIKNPEDFTLGEIKDLLEVLPIDPNTLLAFVGIRCKDINQIQEGKKDNEQI